ncbi:hypothetical protein [Leeuwenhoekiella marinoflava]|uniref:Uncharacterized protein n=2 Tax=Leeuwenhoekiella marinoflava TaxID=988 RepID=A0A4Q0PLS5_9FLAO|nr:hypothetical protein [Leeuwenhoekiella marinoflava]RXG30657.1 hypothetical protein DSL99_1699 [Leeuwenhoekiella marinoflava]SHF20557.1 hypothetical protein SAMN02745246_01958 [Leeuwenhoekiella marinoflava DSM 3653]
MSLKIYLPQKLLERLLDRLDDIKPSKNSIQSLDDELIPLNYKLEKFYLLLAILSDPKGNGFKEVNLNGFNFVPLSSKHLIKIIGNDYKSYLNYLINQGFVLSKSDYSLNKCRYFHLYNSYLTYKSSRLFYCYINKVEESIKTPVNIRIIESSEKGEEENCIEIAFGKNSSLFKIKKRKYDLQTERKKKLPKYIKIDMWNHFKSKMVLDFDKAEEYCYEYKRKYTQKLEQKYSDGKIDKDTLLRAKAILQNKYLNRISTVNNLRNPKKDKSWLFSRKGINRRLNTNLTMMASDLRQFIIGYEDMSYLDLSNSQPVLFNVTLQELKEKASDRLKIEIDKYFEITINGGWYEKLSEVFECDRETAKKNWMLIAYSKNKDCRKLKNKFKKSFPEIFKVIENKKRRDYKQFSIGLQKIESNIFIDVICKRLVENGVLPLSIHDGVLVDKKQTEPTYQIMTDSLSEYIGAIPVIDINGVKRYPTIAGYKN